MRMEVIENGRQVPKDQQKAVLISSTERFHARRIAQAHTVRRAHHITLAAERDSVKRAVMAVEHRLVEAMWVLARLPDRGARGFSNRNGVPYMLEDNELYANAVSNGGWDAPRAKPELPSPKSIDAMYDPLAWLAWLGRTEGRLVAAAASSKRGQAKANVRWRWVRSQVPELADIPTRTLQWRYDAALRDLVAELTTRKAASRA